MGYPVMWFEVMGTNGEALRQFYGSLFQWTFNVAGPMQYGEVNTGDTRGIPGGIGQASAPFRPYGATFYVETPDAAASLAEAERLGGTVVTPPMTVGGDMTIALFADPEGHVVGLVQHQAA